jgi:hypothetical protein
MLKRRSHAVARKNPVLSILLIEFLCINFPTVANYFTCSRWHL